MTIEEAEAEYGKRWNFWSDAEIKKFMQTLEPADLMIPLTLNWAVKHPEWLNESTRKHFMDYMCNPAARKLLQQRMDETLNSN